MRFVCLGCIEEGKFESLPEAEGQQMMERCLQYDDELRRGGHFVGGEALDSSRNAMTLREVDGKIQAIDGPFAETKEMLGGILFLEADNIQHAIELMSKHPGVRMGPFEIRPSATEVNQLIQERTQAVCDELVKNDEQQIRALLDRWAENVKQDCRDNVLDGHAEDVLIYDVLPPMKYETAAAYRASFDEWWPKIDGEAFLDIVDLEVTVGGDVAFATCMIRCGGTTSDGKQFSDTVRSTRCFKKIAGSWKVVHEHASMPLPR